MAASKQKAIIEQQMAASAFGYFRSLAYTIKLNPHTVHSTHSTSHCQFITLSVCHSASSSLCQFVTVCLSLLVRHSVSSSLSLHHSISSSFCQFATVSSSLIQCTQLMHATLVKRPCFHMQFL